MIVAESPPTRQVEAVCAVVDDELDVDALVLVVAFVVVGLEDPPSPPPQAATPIASTPATTANLNPGTGPPLRPDATWGRARSRTGTVAR